MFGYRKGGVSGSRSAIVHEIAERTAAATLPHLTAAAECMSQAELRGYVRAHAWPWICAEIHELVRSGQLAKSRVNELAGDALEKTVHIVARAYANAPVATMPLPHIGVRTAA